jgi:hypothetical protein
LKAGPASPFVHENLAGFDRHRVKPVDYDVLATSSPARRTGSILPGPIRANFDRSPRPLFAIAVESRKEVAG